MSETIIEILIILALILLNGILAMSEAALIAARRARLQNKTEEGDQAARTALKLTENPNLFLSVIQIGITLINVLTGAVSGLTLGSLLAAQIQKIPQLAPYSQTLGLAVVVLSITYFSLILGELAPKRLAIQNPERIASWVAGPMLWFSKILSPLVALLSLSTDVVLRLIGMRQTKPPPVTEDEIRILIEQGTRAGIFEVAEQDMVAGVFGLNDRRVNSLMTPRPEIIWLDLRDSLEETSRKIAANPYSRFPVCQGDLDNVLGTVKAKDLLLRTLTGQPLNLKQVLQPAIFIPETAFASQALEIFKENKEEFLLVIDEFGGVQGLLTINDVVEEIVGDIETDEPRATQRQDGSWLLDGRLGIEEFKEIFKLNDLPNEEDYETLGGFVMMSLGHIPKPSDHFEWSGLNFEIMDMDNLRVDKVLVTTLPARSAAG
jgi:putative hemolysin